MPKPRRPYRVCQVCGRVFTIYLEYDNQLKESYQVYPDFTEHPEYTEEGRPFATAEQESCPHCKPKTAEEPLPFDCGGCGWFLREQTPYDPIGVCKCDALIQTSNAKTEETK